MLIKLNLVDGSTQFIERADFNVSTLKDMNPDILQVVVYSPTTGRVIARKRRMFWKHYIKHVYKPLPNPEKQPEQQPVNENIEVLQQV